MFTVAQAKPELSGEGTTFVGMVFGGSRLALARVGDRGACLLRQGRLHPLADDHSIVGEFLRHHEIAEADAAQHLHRYIRPEPLASDHGRDTTAQK